MTSLAARFKRPGAAVGSAAAIVFAFALAGCAGGSGAGTTTETETPLPETEISEPTAAPEDDERIEANVAVLDARYDEAVGTIEVSSIVTNHIGEGTCLVEATSTSGGAIAGEVEAMPDAQSTVCPTLTLEGVEAGEWSVIVTFDSEEAFGTSEPTPAEVL